MSDKESLLSKSISEKLLIIDPQNINYTIPRSFGVYELTLTTNSKKYRFGNHPVRENELIREFKIVKRIALFFKRDDAKTLATLLNK